MSDQTDMPRFVNRGIRNTLGSARYDLTLAYLGTGFVSTASGRVFLPLVGKARVVPSPDEEMHWAAGWPKWWHALGLVLVCIFLGTTKVNDDFLFGPWASLLLFPSGVFAVLILWIWRERALTERWRPLTEAQFDRTALVVSFLSSWSSLRLFAILGVIVFYVATVMNPLRIFGWPILPSVEQISFAEWLRRCGAGILMVMFLFIQLRACYWLARALFSRMKAVLTP